ncbi:cAMP-dependent protein kinase catalytic subunit [Diplonema papillatum]|nr:cAMP-dependent protein kinase catalytic subunit [Diplonema papillatum]
MPLEADTWEKSQWVTERVVGRSEVDGTTDSAGTDVWLVRNKGTGAVRVVKGYYVGAPKPSDGDEDDKESGIGAVSANEAATQKPRRLRFRRDEEEWKDLLQTLYNMNNPFLVARLGWFKNGDYLYVVSDFCQGGELLTHFREVATRPPGTVPVDLAAEFAAQIVVALDRLHSHRIVYRDLRPGTILLDARGSVRLSGISLMKRIQGGTNEQCGHLQYAAPEIYEDDQAYTFSVDWWSLGIVLFEMLEGYPPFFGDTVAALQKSIASGVCYPSTFSERTVDLLSSLLTVDAGKRLGSHTARGVVDIKQHSFFAAVDWDNLIPSSIAESMSFDSLTDTRFFDTYPTFDDPHLLPAPTET